MASYLEHCFVAHRIKPLLLNLTHKSMENLTLTTFLSLIRRPMLYSPFLPLTSGFTELNSILSPVVNLHMTFFTTVFHELSSLGLGTCLCAPMAHCPLLSQTLLLPCHILCVLHWIVDTWGSDSALFLSFMSPGVTIVPDIWCLLKKYLVNK